MQVVIREKRPGETVFGGGAGVMSIDVSKWKRPAKKADGVAPIQATQPPQNVNDSNYMSLHEQALRDVLAYHARAAKAEAEAVAQAQDAK